MPTMNISLPDVLKSFVDRQVESRGFGTSSAYMQELIRREQERQALRDVMLAGASSPATEAIGPAYFRELRAKVGKGA